MGFLNDISGALFGSSPSEKNQQLPTRTPQQSDALKALLGYLQGGGIGNPLTSYSGDLTAQLGPLATTSLAGLSNLAANPGGILAPQINQAATSALSGDVPDLTSYFENAVAQPIEQNFSETVVPQIKNLLQKTGNTTSSAAGNVSTRALENLSRQLVSAQSSAATQLKNDALNRQLQAIYPSEAANNESLNTLIQTLQAGLTPTSLQEQNISNLYNYFLNQQQSGQQDIADLLSAIQQPTFENVVTQTPGQAGLLQGLAPGIGQGIGTNPGFQALLTSLF